MSFQNLNLDPKILSALESKGYVTPTPIQEQAIPHILEKKDLLGIAQTGTGKTAAFSLPILHNLFHSKNQVKSGSVRALILTPTRELASQIADNIEVYGKDLGLRYAVIFGGVSEKPQITNLQRGVDILIATPGRLMDLADQGYVRFMQLEIFVLDEADRMLDMGFINDIKKIITKIPQNRQTLFFSATMPTTIADLANSILKDPVKVEVTPASTTVERIDQRVNFVERGNKALLLKRYLKEDDAKSVLVFSKTKHGANRVEEFLLQNGITVAAIHGNKSQGARERALESFREGKVQVLIATDIAARGIDIPEITHVINYDIPMDPESYVHRIGRTARAGRQGIAISFCDPSEIKLLQAVEKNIKSKIPVDESHPYHGVEAAPTQRESHRDDRSFNEERGRRNFGHARNRQNGGGQRRSSSERPVRENSGASRGDERRRNDDKKKSGGFLSFIGFGKKKEDSKNNRRPNRDSRFGFGDEKREGGAPERRSSSSSLGRRSAHSDRRGENSDRRSSSEFGSDRRGFGSNRRSSSEFGSDRRGASSDRRSSSSFGSNRRSSDGNRSGSKRLIRDGNSIYEQETHNKTSFGFGWFGKKSPRSKPDLSVDSALGGRDRYPDADKRGGSSFGFGMGNRRRPSNSGGNRSSFGGGRSGGNNRGGGNSRKDW